MNSVVQVNYVMNPDADGFRRPVEIKFPIGDWVKWGENFQQYLIDEGVGFKTLLLFGWDIPFHNK